MIHIPGDHPYGVPELIAGAFVVVMQAWKRNAVVSILTGTVVYTLSGSARDKLASAIQGKGAFRRFKDTVIRLGID